MNGTLQRIFYTIFLLKFSFSKVDFVIFATATDTKAKAEAVTIDAFTGIRNGMHLSQDQNMSPDTDSGRIKKDQQRLRENYWYKNNFNIPTSHTNIVQSVETKLDCSIRHLALEFAIQKLPWASPIQHKHIFDALRLQECPLPSSKVGSSSRTVAVDTEIKSSRSMAQLLRSRRISSTKESSSGIHNKNDGNLRTSQTDSNNMRTSMKENANTEQQQQEQEIRLYVDPSSGNDENPGTLAYPLKTIPSALAASRRIRPIASTDTVTIVLRAGRYFLGTPLRLDSRDNGLAIVAYPKESPVLSGGDPLSLRLLQTPENPSVYAAKLPPRSIQHQRGEVASDDGVDARMYNFTMLFLDRSDRDEDDVRLVWAREPNGHPERDLQPRGYATANGTDSGTWPDPSGAVHVVIGKNEGDCRNSTIYPWHGEDLDPRGGGNWLHYGGSGNRFVDGKGYWNGSVPMGLRFHGSTLNTTNWTPEGYAPSIAHVFHEAYWGNWQFEIDSVEAIDVDGSIVENGDNNGDSRQTAQPRDGRLSFKRGGWQEGRGGFVKNQPFFVEGVKEALDMPGEWWLDVPDQVLYYHPHGNETTVHSDDSSIHQPSTNSVESELKIDFVAPRLQRLIEVVGEGSDDGIADTITLRGLKFVHTASTFMEAYEVPSPGDWSVHRGGALFVENAREITIQDCTFLRTGGNAVVLSGHTKRTHLSRNEFALIGDSAIVTLGKISMADGFTVDTYPEDTFIEHNHFREIGIHGKQTSALFSALSCKTTFKGNVLYNGPRAGINLNDQFCHGHTIEDNLLFNWVRETQDHGPINTWDRAMYIQKAESSESKNGNTNPTLVPRWTYIERNFIMNGPSRSPVADYFVAIDNDDGSSYYYIAKNFLVYGGGKNYLGNDKLWISNLFVYPGIWSCVQLWGGKNHYFAENTCLVGPGDPPIGLDGSTLGADCLINWDDPVNNLPFVGMTANNTYYLDVNYEWGFGCGNGTSPDHFFSMDELQKHGWELGSLVKDSNLLQPDAIVDLAQRLLVM